MSTKAKEKIVVTNAGDVEFNADGKKLVLKNSLDAFKAVTLGGTAARKANVLYRDSEAIVEVVAAGMGKEVDDDTYEMVLKAGLNDAGNAAQKFLEALDIGVVSDKVTDVDMQPNGNVTFKLAGKEHLLRFTLDAGRDLTRGQGGLMGRVQRILDKDGSVIAGVIAKGFELDEVDDTVWEIVRRAGLEAMKDVALKFLTSIANGGRDPVVEAKKAKEEKAASRTKPELEATGEVATDPQTEA